jgi:hypothetical protein
MAQKKVTRKELEEMRVGSTRVFQLIEPSKLQAVASTATQMKNERKGEWTVRKDYESISVSVTRIK